MNKDKEVKKPKVKKPKENEKEQEVYVEDDAFFDIKEYKIRK